MVGFMESCEICGAETEKIYVIEIEGAEMRVCSECAKGKKIISAPENGAAKHHGPAKAASDQPSEMIEHYGEAIRKARNSLGIPLNVLAEKINEKESTLLRVEEEKMLPSVGLTKKLERELGIRLTVASEESSEHISGWRSQPITLGDAAIKKEKHEKGN
ncbi:MAG: multiprotein bridging factor aMBF1, partial [Candidatus Micrarchaeaceae archaeon]